MIIVGRSTPRLGQVLNITKDEVVVCRVLNTTASRNTGKEQWYDYTDTFHADAANEGRYYVRLTHGQADRVKRGSISMSKLQRLKEGEE